MDNINEVYEKYAKIDIGDLSSNQKDAMYNMLKTTRPGDLHSIDEHRKYVEILQKLRMANMKDMKLIGEKFIATMESLLAVGEDGVYSNHERFIYELIQNVDDCEYENIEDCQLNIQFKYNTSPGQIVLIYNEKGFSPENVFAITGIAEKSKNISADKVEIGEKGIGFKSVFGIADKVLIESGSFSFELHRNNFTVPIPKYDGFVPIKGTRMTLEMPESDVYKVYRRLVEQYCKGDAALNKNPILFLNKLTHLKMHFDDFRYIEFNVQRKPPKSIHNIDFEDDVTISVDMKDHHNGRDKEYNGIISCRRYTQPLIYGEDECKARYGEDAPFTEKRHNLIALFPILTGELKDFREGLLYSFLPTQIPIDAPLILHVPYKLDGSREFVDPQGENLWFQFTSENLALFLRKIYIHLATVVKEDIVAYLPNRNRYFFKKENEKIQCLQQPGLKSDAICMEKIFFTADGTYENVNDIVSFAMEEELSDPKQVHRLLGEKNKLFLPRTPVDMRQFGARVISNVPEILLRKGLVDETVFGEIMELLEDIGRKVEYEQLIEKSSPLKLTKEHMLVIDSHKEVHEAFKQYFYQCLTKKKPMGVSVGEGLVEAEESFKNEIKELIEEADLNCVFKDYLKDTDFKIYLLDGVKREYVLAGKNGIVLSAAGKIGAFGELASKYDQRRTFSAALQIRQASVTLDAADEDDTICDAEYLKQLREVRSSLKRAYGQEAYNSYLRIINQAGTDSNRFLNELLQNADDCQYAEGVLPNFELRKKASRIIVSYNELGFTKKNVRAITAIGESTKKSLLIGSNESIREIGEKGVGFKSVFGVAKSVEIHSNGFDFKLTDKIPTIPRESEPLADGRLEGTTLVFEMKTDVSEVLKEENLLKLCLCLRKLCRIKVLGTEITITDTDRERIVTISGKKYHFEKFVYNFTVTDQEAINERNANHKTINGRQSIFYYIPTDHKSERYPLYVGLPTLTECGIPLVIDAPFELTTSRDNVVRSRWNTIVRDNVHYAILELMKEKREELKIDVLKYVDFSKKDGVLSYQIFSESEKYLNDYNWTKALGQAEILPVLNQERFVSPVGADCLIVSDIIAYILKKFGTVYEYDGEIIDTYRKRQYIQLLKHIGCEESSISDDLSCIESVAGNLVKDDEFRKELYNFLTNDDNQKRIREQWLYEKVKALPIYPIRTKTGVQYVPYSKKIFIHNTKLSDDEFQILETKILEYDELRNMLGGAIIVNELTQEIVEARYQSNLKAYIRSDASETEKAEYILNEYLNNRENFERCRDTLRGMIDDIPMKMLSGSYYTGYKFINKRGLVFSGTLIKEFVVAEQFVNLAEFLGCTDVSGIHYDEIDMDLSEISDDDIEDFQSGFVYYAEILGGFVEAGIISDEQIEKFNLQYLVRAGADDDDFEDFPGQSVVDLQRLRRLIREQFRRNPNHYVERQHTVRVPEKPVDKEAYTISMYGSEYTENKCFCQMCGDRVDKRYIERNDVQKTPKYGWPQMYLSLCLNCSKDYILLRSNQTVWEEFIRNILRADVEEEDMVEISIGNKSLTFTAVHLAEIQAILELEKEEENNSLDGD